MASVLRSSRSAFTSMDCFLKARNAKMALTTAPAAKTIVATAVICVAARSVTRKSLA